MFDFIEFDIFFSKIVPNRPWTTKARTKGRTRTKGIGKGIGFSSVTYGQDLKENCFKLQKQLEEATQSREKLQKECVELQTVKKITRSTSC